MTKLVNIFVTRLTSPCYQCPWRTVVDGRAVCRNSCPKWAQYEIDKAVDKKRRQEWMDKHQRAKSGYNPKKRVKRFR